MTNNNSQELGDKINLNLPVIPIPRSMRLHQENWGFQ